jgi:membrane protein DedA with SNARE-associated domain
MLGSIVLYLSIFGFAILEGEIFYSAMCARTVSGDLWWLPVILAGALGGATGDQLWFYVLRRRIHWLDRFPRLGKYRDIVSHRIRAHETGMVLASRFLPGLRTAIPIACAYGGVQPIKFSVLNLASAFAWASAIMLLVRGGSATLVAFGLEAWWGPFIPAAMLVLFLRWLVRVPRAK